MKKILLFTAVLMINTFNTNGQSIVTSSGSKSGILVGNIDNFAGIGFESADDRFTFIYKFTRKDKSLKKPFPNFWGFNIGSGIKIDKGKGSLYTDKQWQGGIDFDFTFSRTWDFSSEAKRESTEGDVTQYKVDRQSQYTLYCKVSDAFERFNSATSTFLNTDTTFLSFGNPMQNTVTITPGFYGVNQLKSRWFFSYAASCNFNIISNSTRKLSKLDLLPVTNTYLNSKDSSTVNEVGEQTTYFNGVGDLELFIVPRVDLFIRHQFNSERAFIPVLGFIASYSPQLSSFSSVLARHNIAFGPTVGLNGFPDQVVFALLNEFNESATGDFKYKLTFNVTFPLKFK